MFVVKFRVLYPGNSQRNMRSLTVILALLIVQVYGSKAVYSSDNTLEAVDNIHIVKPLVDTEYSDNGIFVPSSNHSQNQVKKPYTKFLNKSNKTPEVAVSGQEETVDVLSCIVPADGDSQLDLSGYSLKRFDTASSTGHTLDTANTSITDQTLAEKNDDDDENTSIISVITAHGSSSDDEEAVDNDIHDVPSIPNSEVVESKTDEVINSEPPRPSMFPHVVGIRNHALNCYASALISCLYNIPMFQVAIFEDVKRNISNPMTKKDLSPTVALAAIFNKMRSGRSFINLEPYFVPAVKRTTHWEFGGTECVLEFWNLLSTTLSAETQSLFKIDLSENRFRKSDNLLIKSETQSCNIILVSPSKKYRDIEQFLENHFADEDAEGFIIEPKDRTEYSHLLTGETEEKLRIPSRTTLDILNCPNILIFGIKRVRWNPSTSAPEFDSSPLGFPETLTINSERYTIVGNVEYDPRRVHYYAQNHDLLDDQWYLHDDKRVKMIPDIETAFEDLSLRFVHNSTMVFYVKCSLLEQFQDGKGTEIDAEVISLLKSRKTILTKRPLSDSGSETSKPDAKKNRNDSEKKVETKKKVVTMKKLQTMKKMETMKKPLRKGPRKQPVTEVNDTDENTKIDSQVSLKKGVPKRRRRTGGILMTSETLKPFKEVNEVKETRIGTEFFSFNSSDKIGILEAILFAYARNPAVLSRLIQVSIVKEPTDFVFRFTVALLKILTGKQGIDVSDLKRELVETHKVSLNNYYEVSAKVSELLPEDISPSPETKVIKYHLDEPMAIVNPPKSANPHVLPHRSVAIPKDLVFNGLVCDHKESEDGEYYRRSVFRSQGIVLPLFIARLIKAKSPGEGHVYDRSPIHFGRNKFILNGFIGFKEGTFDIFAIFLDARIYSHYIFYMNGSVKLIPKTKQYNQEVSQYLDRNSIIIMFSKLQHLKVEYPSLSQVPKVLVDELNK